MDPINDYSDVIVISDDDDDVNSEFKDEDNLGDKDNHFVRTRVIEIPLDESQIPDSSVIKETKIIEKRYHCHYCGLSFPEDHLLKKHLENHKQLKNTDKKLTCKFCGKLFRFNFQLKRHVRRKMYQYSDKIYKEYGF